MRLRRALLLLFLWVGLAGTVVAQVRPVPQEALVAHLDSVRVRSRAPGLAVAIAVGGEVVFAQGVGEADMSNAVPFTPQTVENIGSVAKVFGATAVLQLAEAGRVDLDATIQTYVPFFPEKRWPVTVRQVLTHTAGIRHYREDDLTPNNTHRAYASLEEGIRFWADDSLLYEPGTWWSYTSHGANLLQGVVETASGMGYGDYLQAHVFGPAGMAHSGLDIPAVIVAGRGRGYVYDEGGTLRNADFEDPSYKYVGGGLISTVEDLARFGVAVRDGTLMDPATWAQMVEPQVSDSIRYFNQYDPDAPLLRLGRVKRQGLMWTHEQDDAGRWWIGHSGAASGVKTMLLIYPAYDLVVAFQANVQQIDPKREAEALAAMLLPEPEEPQSP